MQTFNPVGRKSRTEDSRTESCRSVLGPEPTYTWRNVIGGSAPHGRHSRCTVHSPNADIANGHAIGSFAPPFLVLRGTLSQRPESTQKLTSAKGSIAPADAEPSRAIVNNQNNFC